MSISRHYDLNNRVRKIVVFTAAMAVIVSLFVPIPITASEEPAPGIIYRNDFNSGTDSMIDTTDNDIGNVTFDLTEISNSEIDNNIGIGASMALKGNCPTVSFLFNRPQSCGILSCCFDISKAGKTDFSKEEYVQKTKMILNKSFQEEKTSLSITDKIISGPSDDIGAEIDSQTAALYTENEIHHIQQIFDLNNKKIYTLVDGKPLSYTEDGKEVPAVRNLDNDFELKSIDINLSAVSVFFDDLKIEYIADAKRNIGIENVTAGDDNKSVYVEFSEPICAKCLAKENFDVTTADKKAVEIKDACYDGCNREKLVLAEDMTDNTLNVSVHNTDEHIITNGVGAALSETCGTFSTTFDNPIIYDNDFENYIENGEKAMSLVGKNPNVQNTKSWVAEYDDNDNMRMKLKEANRLTVMNNNEHDSFTVCFDIQPKESEQDEKTYETSVCLSYLPEGSDTDTELKIFSIARKYIKYAKKYKSIISGITGTGQNINYESGKPYHIDIAYNPKRDKVYSYVDGVCISESAAEVTSFKSLIMDFDENTDYLDNLKIYEFNGFTQDLEIVDAPPKSEEITVRTKEPLNAAKITAAGFSVSENGSETKIEDVTLRENNTEVVITLSQPLDCGKEYAVTAKKGLKNFADMSTESDISTAVTANRNVELEKCVLSSDNTSVEATVRNKGTGRAEAVLIVCAYTSDSIIPDKILVEDTFENKTEENKTLAPNDVGKLVIKDDFKTASRVVALLWENLNGCVPYCKAVDLKPTK